ncbi:glycosyl hydrolase family 28-related protein [Streptomyces sp. SBT349]|uniref:glycosyl hydrolase family 28-related protein n=1 Tax=Streptomyces sp. SBT349 TaxID=1580539 RepID=UPI00066B031B|nr:glycosyl hydrolase family 28-related protein [Streptomyces sp. SBT349]
MEINRKTVLRGAIGTAAAAMAGTAWAAAPAAARGGTGAGRRAAALWEELRSAPYTHPQIPYVGRAGGFGGRTRLPRRPVVADARDFGAVPDGSADSAAALNRAIEEAGARGGGTVLLPAGDYRLDDIVRIGHDNVVLRGAGSGLTTLRPTRNLTDLVGWYGSRYGGDKSSWSWAGGLVWICPDARWRSLTDAIRARAWPFEGWTGNARDAFEEITAVEPARRGDLTVTVADAEGLAAGDRVLLRLADDEGHSLLAHMAGDPEGAASYDWDACTKLTSYVPYEWPCVLVSVDPARRQVTLDRPLPLDARPEWRPRLTTLVTPVVGSGIEGVTLAFPETPQAQHLLDTGWNGVALQCAWDCWAEDVTVTNADNGFLMVAAKACTLRRTRVSGRGSHHPYCCREGSHDNLVEDFVIEPRTTPTPPNTQLHGINVEGLSSYNVWSRGVMEMGTFDSHRGMPFANVRTEITVNNNGTHGGDASAGPLYGARFAHWNVTVTNERAGMIKIDGIAPFSATVGISEVTEFGQIDVPDFDGPLHTRIESYGDPGAVRPRNLYDAQRELG